MGERNRDMSRRELLARGAAVGGLALTGSLGTAFAQESAADMFGSITPGQGLGPFYPIMKPLDQDADLTVVQGGTGRAEGQVIHLMGRVVDLRGEPVPGANIELWQADTHGRYKHASDPNPASIDPNFQGYSIQQSDSEGRYRFKTIKPAAYPVPEVANPQGKRPPHIHFDVAGKTDRLVTQMYFPDEPLNDTDSVFLGAPEAYRQALIAKVMPPTEGLEPDSLLVVWDIVLPQG